MKGKNTPFDHSHPIPMLSMVTIGFYEFASRSATEKETFEEKSPNVEFRISQYTQCPSASRSFSSSILALTSWRFTCAQARTAVFG
jgi:hypothetical protein